MPPKTDNTKKGNARKGRPAGSRLAYDDTKQEMDKPAPRKRGRPAKAKTEDTGKAPAQSKGKGTGTWMAHVKKTHIAGKKKNPSYTYKQAMADAKKTYKK
jgi:hypothetical protein